MGKEEQMRGLVKRWVEHCNSTQSTEGMENYLTEDYKWHLDGQNIYGLEAVKQAFKNLLSEQELTQIVEDVIVSGDKVVVRWSYIHKRRSSSETWRSSGVTIDVVRDGKFAEGWELSSDKSWPM